MRLAVLDGGRTGQFIQLVSGKAGRDIIAGALSCLIPGFLRAIWLHRGVGISGNAAVCWWEW